MAENVQDVTFEISKAVQATLVEFRSEVNERLDRLEAGMRKDRRNAAGMLVMTRATAGDFDQRVTDLEERLERLEAARS